MINQRSTVKRSTVAPSTDLEPLVRCDWIGNDPLMLEYHDHEWGVPAHDDRRLFEFIVLSGAQAGLSWITILRKRDAYREAFADFDPLRIARFDQRKIASLLQNDRIVRNRRKIEGAVRNARAFVALRQKGSSLDEFMWEFVNRKPIVNHWKATAQIPTATRESDAMSKAMKKAGFTFFGTTICYAHMQAVGMVNDHLVTCFRHRALTKG